MSEPLLLAGVRAVVLDPDDRVLLVRFEFPEESLWATPGGGIEPGETYEQALVRELEEEAGLTGVPLGPAIWTREHVFPLGRWDGQAERYHLVRAPAFEPRPKLSWEELRDEYVLEIRWWTLAELEASDALFAPRRFPALLRQLLEEGPPQAPIDVGV